MTERHKETDLPFSGSLTTWLQQPWSGQAEARYPELHQATCLVARPRTLGHHPLLAKVHQHRGV